MVIFGVGSEYFHSLTYSIILDFLIGKCTDMNDQRTIAIRTGL